MTTTSGNNPSRPTPVSDAWRESYQAHLREAIRVLTEAARLRRPRLIRTDDGDFIDDLMEASDQADWAEFVTQALAGAAANFGGVDAILAGRSGSWEAEGVRQLHRRSRRVDVVGTPHRPA
jgi:hypothetical protein